MELPGPSRDKTPDAQFVFGIEQETLTTLEGSGDPFHTERAAFCFLQEMRKLTPSASTAGGFFNPYGRVYLDIGAHLEFASVECDCPYQLALLVERQQALAAKTLSKLAQRGIQLVLANNNHSGVLHRASPTWGAHESYYTSLPPRHLGPVLLPFLATRLYGGSGGVEFPTGCFLASVRAEFMEVATGGDTTNRRAVLSTGRDESLMPRTLRSYRLHLILGDGHRSQFNLGLQVGATALALKAVEWDPELPDALAALQPILGRGTWVNILQEVNRLAAPGSPPRVDPRVVSVQRVYLEAARRYVASLPGKPPAWVPSTLRDWADTLSALERGDRPWLSSRLDAFAKYELYSCILDEAGVGWAGLAGQESLFHELALLDQGYHEFCNPRSPFRRLEEEGLLRHRVGKFVPAGGEVEPFIPEVGTRAAARARFLVDNADNPSLFMDWARVVDVNRAKEKRLDGPFARRYGRWLSCEVPDALLHFVMDS